MTLRSCLYFDAGNAGAGLFPAVSAGARSVGLIAGAKKRLDRRLLALETVP